MWQTKRCTAYTRQWVKSDGVGDDSTGLCLCALLSLFLKSSVADLVGVFTMKTKVENSEIGLEDSI